jgi:hypothetical protein
MFVRILNCAAIKESDIQTLEEGFEVYGLESGAS